MSSCELLSECGPARAENQDAGLVWRGEDGDLALIVSDGMGGHAEGRLAAEIVVRLIHGALAGRRPGSPWREVLSAALAAAHLAVRAAQEERGAKGMGATAAVALVAAEAGGPRLYLAHVGDSRVYLLRGRSLYRLTEDHSLVAQMVRDGWIGEDEALGHPESNVLQRAIGQAGPLVPEVPEPAPLESGDLVLVSTDGLHGSVPEDEIGRLAGGGDSAAQICRRLLAAALRLGSLDNITIGCCRLAERRGRRQPTRVPRTEEER